MSTLQIILFVIVMMFILIYLFIKKFKNKIWFTRSMRIFKVLPQLVFLAIFMYHFFLFIYDSIVYESISWGIFLVILMGIGFFSMVFYFMRYGSDKESGETSHESSFSFRWNDEGEDNEG